MRLLAADITCFENHSLFNRLYHSVHPVRKAKIDALRYAEDKFLSLGAGILLKVALQDAGYNYENARFIRNEWGRPMLSDGAFSFSLSHSGNYAMCAVSDREIGCDVQKRRAIHRSVVQRLFSEEEKRQIDAGGEEAFCRIWSLKESYLKMIGMGLNMGLGDFSITLGSNPVIEQDAIEGSVYLREFRDIRDYCFGVCAREPIRGNLEMIDLRQCK